MSEIQLKLDRNAAIRKIRASRNKAICLYVGNQFESTENPDMGYNLTGAIRVNAKQAENFLLDAIRDQMVDKVIVKIHITEYTMFIS
jgi:hypothetical protein